MPSIQEFDGWGLGGPTLKRVILSVLGVEWLEVVLGGV